MPYVAYWDNSTGYPIVKKYNGNTYGWDSEGSSVLSHQAHDLSFVIAPNNTQYIALSESENSARGEALYYNGYMWLGAGSVLFSNNTSSQYNSLAANSQNEIYVAYSGAENSYKAAVRKFDGANWTTVGSTGGFSAGQAAYVSMAIAADGTPYVAYKDLAYSNKVTVMKYSGGLWVGVGNAGFSAGAADYVSLAVDSGGTPYVAYSDGSVASKATIMKYDGHDWVTVGSAGFSAGAAGYVSLAINKDDIPYVAFEDGGNNNKATVMRYCVQDTVLSTGNADRLSGIQGTVRFTSNEAGSYYYKIVARHGGAPAISADDPATYDGTGKTAAANTETYISSLAGLTPGAKDIYIIVKDIYGNVSKTLKVEMHVESVWQALGGAGFSDTGGYEISIAADGSGTPYVAYVDGSSGGNIVVKKFNGSVWVTLSDYYFAAKGQTVSLAVDGSGTPYIAYNDLDNAWRATVMKFVPSDAVNYHWITVGGAALSTNAASGIKIAVGSDGAPYVAYMDSGASAMATVMKYDTGSGTWIALENGFGDGPGGTQTLAVALDGSNTPYLAYEDEGRSQAASVYKYGMVTPPGAPFSIPDWIIVGQRGFSGNRAEDISIALDSSNTPYVAVAEAGGGNAVMKFNGSSWITVGGTGFAADGAIDVSIAIDGNNAPYVVYRDESSGGGSKAIVKKYDGYNWVTPGGAGFSSGQAEFTSMAIDNDGILYVAYKDYDNSGKVTVMEYMPGFEEPSTAVTLQTASADGWPNVTTSTRIVLTFDTAIAGLTASDIIITSGSGTAVKGTLSGGGTNWSIALTSVTTQGNVAVTVAAPAGYTISGSPKTVAVYKDTTAPALSSGSVNRTGDTAATIGFTTSEAGTAYYKVVDAGAAAPSKEAVAAETSLGAVSDTVAGTSVSLTAGAKDIYVVVKDAADNISDVLKIETEAYVVPGNDVTFTATQTGGTNGMADSTGIVLMFSKTVTGLTADNISIANGTGSVVRGTFSGSGTTWTIGLSGVEMQGNVTVSVADFGTFHVTTASQTVAVYKNTGSTPPAGHTITASAGSGGSTSPGGAVYVIENDTQVFYIIPDSGYQIASVLVDGTNNASAVSSGMYTFDGVTADHTISATFAAQSYTVSFDKQGGTGTAEPITVTYGLAYGTLPAGPTKTGYIFAGWYTAASGGARITPSTTVGADAAGQTLYAHWNSAAPTVAGVTVTPLFATVQQGSTQAFSATVAGANNPAQTVAWSVTGGVAGTSISSSGVLTVASGETASTLTVRATSTVDGTKFGTAAVTVSAASTTGHGDASSSGGSPTLPATPANETPAGTLTVESAPAGGGTVQAKIKADDLARYETLTVQSEITVSFDKAATDTIKAAEGNVTITITRVETTTLSSKAQAVIGDRPVYDFSVKSGDDTVSDFKGGSVTVSVPYAPKAGEDINALVVYYIDATGAFVPVIGAYNSGTGTIDFMTTHFSKYAVGYNPVEFKDVADTAWYKNAVTFIAAREITAGTGNGNYSPEAKLARGEFIVLMMRAYGIAPDANPADNFSDAGNTYYTVYLAAAKRLGITNGIGDNMYAPGNQITRQEMFTLLYNALKVIGQLPQGDSGKSLSCFTDAGQIAPWAKDAMTLLVETGTIGGSSGRLTPKGTATRAEMAQVLYKLLGK